MSILLAFAIDAWWQRQSEAEAAAGLIAGLRSDFTASQRHLSDWRAGNERILIALNDFRDRLSATPQGEEIDVPEEWLIALVSTPTYSPTASTLDAAISSGQIELLDDEEIRRLLALWKMQLEDTAEDELLVRRIAVDQLVPRLAEQLRLGDFFEFDRILDWFLEQDSDVQYRQFRLRALSELEGLLGYRIFYSTFVTRGLADIETTQEEILNTLEALGRRR